MFWTDCPGIERTEGSEVGGVGGPTRSVLQSMWTENVDGEPDEFNKKGRKSRREFMMGESLQKGVEGPIS